MNKKIGKRVAAIRRQRGYTQEQLAEKMGMSVSAISRLEKWKQHGKHRTPW